MIATSVLYISNMRKRLYKMFVSVTRIISWRTGHCVDIYPAPRLTKELKLYLEVQWCPSRFSRPAVAWCHRIERDHRKQIDKREIRRGRGHARSNLSPDTYRSRVVLNSEGLSAPILSALTSRNTPDTNAPLPSTFFFDPISPSPRLERDQKPRKLSTKKKPREPRKLSKTRSEST